MTVEFLPINPLFSFTASLVTATKISETSLLDYLVHPITVTSISLSGLKDEQRKDTIFVGAIFNEY